MSRRRLVLTYATVVTTLSATAWFATNAVPLMAAPQEQGQTADDAKLDFPDTGSKRIRLSRTAAAAKLRYKHPPEYPALAKQARLQGVVRLAVLIAPDGRVIDLYTISGEPVLAEAAVEAVRKWEYTTTLLNGNPVEVVTTVEVTFTLAP